MNDTSGKTSSSLVISEKRPQRPGGCVGIFFQLIDWNRRLAKKKLFSKKLLPPARTSRVSKKFGEDEKFPMAKLLLIADENRGGFPNAKKSDIDCVKSSADTKRTNEMRSPGLVARLMGLESMPVRRDKPKKVSFSEFYHDQEKTSVSNHSIRTTELFHCDQDDFNLEKGYTKLESRPQKLQKTGLFERRPVTRFGAEALQFRSVLSRSRKHHPKLASPVKSPRIPSGRKAARLMEAATKILEPGLQATNRAKSALTYSPSLHLPPKDEVMTERITVLTPDQSKQPTYYGSTDKSLKGQSSCKSCGNFLDVLDFRSNVEEQVPGFTSSALDMGTAPSHGSGRSKPKPAVSSHEQERDVVPKNQEQPVTVGAQARANIHARSENFTDGKSHFRKSQDQHRMSGQRIKSQRDVASATALKQRTQRKNQMPLTKDRVTPRPKSSNLQSKRDSFAVGSVNGAKDFVALNRNSTSQTRTKMPPKVLDNCKIGTERNACDKRDDSSSRLRASVCKRRPVNGTAQVENIGFSQSPFGKQRNVGGDVIIGKVMGLNPPSVNQNGVKSECPSLAKGDAAGGRKDIDVVSFTFSSPLRHSTESAASTETMEKRGEVMCSSTSHQKKLALDNSSSQKATQWGGDALGILLEEKLKELTCRDRDELETGDVSGRSTASILQELISALTAGRPSSWEEGDNCSVGFSQEDSLCYGIQDPSDVMSMHGQMLNTNRKFQAEAKAAGVSVGFPLAGDGDHPSPGSVLEASFSNSSCFSESLDGSSGQKLHPEAMECSYGQPQPSEPDPDLSDSATSLNTCGGMTDSINSISRLFGIDPADIGLVGRKLNHAREVIVNAELLFGDTALYDAYDMEDFPIVPLLLDKLEIHSVALWRSPKCSTDFMEDKDGSQLRRFLFDCVIECLDSKYGRYSKSSFKAWPKLPIHISGELLAWEVYEEIKKWTNFAGKITDEIIERDMSHSLGKWTDFEIEAFEEGTEIEWDILQVLVDELVIDLWKCRARTS